MTAEEISTGLKTWIRISERMNISRKVSITLKKEKDFDLKADQMDRIIK